MTNPIKNIDPIEEEFVKTIGDEHSKRIENEIDAIRALLSTKKPKIKQIKNLMTTLERKSLQFWNNLA
jgi:hypothetical protein